MSAGGSQTTWVDIAPELWCGCHRMSSGCKYCRAMEHDIGCVVHGKMVEWMKIEAAPPGSLVLLCPSSDPFIEEAEKDGWWVEMVKYILARPDLMFVALTKRLEQAKKFVARFGVLPNLWIGTSAEDQRTLDERIPLLYSIPAVGYVISVQPLLAPVDLEQHLRNKKLHKIIAGREMGTKARPCQKAWLDKISAQCKKHGIKCFITRYRNKDGKAVANPTESDRGSRTKGRPAYRSTRSKKLIGKMMGLVVCSRCNHVFMPERKTAKSCPFCKQQKKLAA